MNMAKINSKQFVLGYVQRYCPPDIEDVDALINHAVTIYERVDKLLSAGMPERKPGTPKSGQYITARGRILEGDPLEWFENVWTAWNDGLKVSKGGKKDAADAFIDQKLSYEKARQMYAAARLHASVERKENDSKGTTNPYFNRWCNSGRWDKKLVTTKVFDQAKEKDDPAVKERKEIREKISDQKGVIRQFEKLGQTQFVDTAKKRINELEGKLQQLERNKNDSKDPD